MKHVGSISDFTAEKNRELLVAFRKAGGVRGFADTPASRFWVSETRAAIVMRRIENGETLEEMNVRKREMFLELYRRMKKLQRSRPHLRAKEAMQELVYQPAPSFYISHDRAERLVRDLRAEHRREAPARTRILAAKERRIMNAIKNYENEKGN